MDSYKGFKKEVLNVESTWKLFESYKCFKQLYIRYMYRTRLICRVTKKLRTYKRKTTPLVETIKTILEPNKRIEVINIIGKNIRPIYSLKIKCKIEINDWALNIVGLIDTGCSNTILDKKLVPPQYHKPIPFIS